MRRLTSAIIGCALVSLAASGVHAQSFDSPKVQELYAAAKKEGQDKEDDQQ